MDPSTAGSGRTPNFHRHATLRLPDGINEVIKRRRMVHAFTAEPLAPGTAERLLQAANRAPSAGFSQGYSFLVLEGRQEAGLPP
jgi:nitroreductase